MDGRHEIASRDIKVRLASVMRGRGNVLGGSTRRFDRMTRDMAQDVAISCPGIATRSVTPSALLLQR